MKQSMEMRQEAEQEPWTPDGFGHAIPLQVIGDAREMRAELTEVAASVLRVRKLLKRMEGGALPQDRYDYIREKTTSLLRLVETTIPAALCPYCLGLKKDCAACHGVGCVGQGIFEVAKSAGLCSGPVPDQLESTGATFADDEGYVDEREPPAEQITLADQGPCEEIWEEDEDE